MRESGRCSWVGSGRQGQKLDEVAFHGLAHPNERGEVLLAHPMKRFLGQGLAQDVHPVDHRARLWGQVEAPPPPVDGVGAPRDESRFFQAVDDASDRDGVHFEPFREVPLAQSFLAPDEFEGPPLRPSEAKSGRAAIESGPQMAGHIMKQDRNGQGVGVHGAARNK